MAPWPSGKAKVCNTSTPSPNLGGASKKDRTPIGVLSFLPSLTNSGWHRATCRTGSGSQIRRKDVPRLRGNSSANLVPKGNSLGGAPNGVLSFLLSLTNSDRHRASRRTGSGSQIRRKDVPRLRGNSSANLVPKGNSLGGTIEWAKIVYRRSELIF